MTTFAVRTEILKEALENPEFSAKWDNCTRLEDFETLLVEWCKKKILPRVKAC